MDNGTRRAAVSRVAELDVTGVTLHTCICRCVRKEALVFIGRSEEFFPPLVHNWSVICL